MLFVLLGCRAVSWCLFASPQSFLLSRLVSYFFFLKYQPWSHESKLVMNSIRGHVVSISRQPIHMVLQRILPVQLKPVTLKGSGKYTNLSSAQLLRILSSRLKTLIDDFKNQSLLRVHDGHLVLGHGPEGCIAIGEVDVVQEVAVLADHVADLARAVPCIGVVPITGYFASSGAFVVQRVPE